MLGLYSFALAVALVAGAPYWIYRGLRERKYLSSFRVRLGSGLPSAPPVRPVWVHAVSVGEVVAAKPLVHALRRARPDIPVIASTVTLTGHELAGRELGADALFYFPFDWTRTVDRFLAHFQPRAVVLLETELWPNFMARCAARGIPVLLANGRLSERSRRRFGRIPRFAARLLERLAGAGVQTHQDRRRFLELGLPEARIRVTGNLKFDFPAADGTKTAALLEALRRRLAADDSVPIVVVGSSMKGEEPLFLDAFRRIRTAVPGARLILAPRHPERFEEVADLMRRSGIPFVRRSSPAVPSTQEPEMLLLDSIGELRSVYGLATVAVVGGSFIPPFGGHNLLEPAGLGKPIVFGPKMTNFAELASLFLREQAARQCPAADLARSVTELLENPRARDLLGQRAGATFRHNQGATQSTLEMILPHLG